MYMNILQNIIYVGYDNVHGYPARTNEYPKGTLVGFSGLPTKSHGCPLHLCLAPEVDETNRPNALAKRTQIKCGASLGNFKNPSDSSKMLTND